ncbi:MAG: C-GCAxxG-C-C family (seleno)protein [Kosmotogaceae bacterium]
MLEDAVGKQYSRSDVERNCAEAMIYGADDEYKLNLPEEVFYTMGAFGGGMRIKSICGAVTGSLAVIGILFNSEVYEKQERMKRITEEFLEEFEKKYGHLECSVLRDKYRDPIIGCETTVRMAAKVLEKLIEKYSGEITYGVK